MKNYYFLIIGVLVLIFAGFFVFAQELSGVTYPVSELGNCQSKDDCAAYCDKAENMEACLDFAQAHNLLPALEIKMARDMLELGETAGPGGCQGQIECAAYCDEISHIKECITFAEENNLIPPEELGEAKKVMAAMEKGLTPPNCKSKSECDVYCQKPEHMEECITFGEAAGLIPPEELKDAKKALEAVKKGAKPPACQGKEACDTYCAEPEHIEECINFAQAAGFMSPEEAAMAKRTGGKGPGGCRGKEVCNAFCEEPANMEACISFGLEYGFVPAEEIENTKKTLQALKKGVSPPNCRGEEECNIYCSQPEHSEECINFSEAAGFMSPEEAEKARQGMGMMQQGGPGGCKGREECEAYCNELTHMEECLLFSYEAGLIPSEDLENTQKIIGAIQKGAHMLPCRNEEECGVYCATPEHMEECTNFAEAAGFITSEEAGQSREGMIPPEGGVRPEGMMPPEGMPPVEGGMPPEGMIAPPEGMTPPPEGMTPPEGMMPPPEDMVPTEGMPPSPPEGIPPSPEGEIPQPPPPPSEGAPQSFFERAQNFLGGLLPILREK